MTIFPREYSESGRRVLEAPGEVMDDVSEAVAYRGTAGKMWRFILRPFARKALKLVPPDGRILDLGTGPGLMPAWWAAERPDIEAVGVDLSPAMLGLARANAERRSVAGRAHFMCADATDTGLPSGSFDVVVCHYMLHHFADPGRVLREMTRLVKPGGAVLVRDLARPRPWFARLSTVFTSIFLGNDLRQNRQYAESLAAGLTASELRAVVEREELSGFEVRGGPIHVALRRVPAAARAPMTHERLGRVLAGATLLIGALLSWLISPLFLLVVVGTGLNLAISGLTDNCPVKSLLLRMGVPGERDVGRAEASLSGIKRGSIAFRRVSRPSKVPTN